MWDPPSCHSFTDSILVGLHTLWRSTWPQCFAQTSLRSLHADSWKRFCCHLLWASLFYIYFLRSELLQRVACYGSTQGRKSAGNNPHQKTFLIAHISLKKNADKSSIKLHVYSMTSMIRQVINISLLTCQHKCIIYVNAVINDVRFNFLRKN